MKYQKRASIILELLQKEATVTADYLSEILSVSLVTIRKDLQRLEDEGKLIRIFGGATSLDHINEEQHRQAAMQRVAERAVAEINEGDCIILNAGVTTHLIAKRLKDYRSLRVITNAVDIARELNSCKGIMVILLGGEMSSDAVFTRGSEGIDQLEQYKADKAFLSVSGISCSRGITTKHMEVAALFCKMIERADEVIVVADDGKLGFESFYHICDLSQIHKIITNDSPENEEELRQMQEQNIEVCRC